MSRAAASREQLLRRRVRWLTVVSLAALTVALGAVGCLLYGAYRWRHVLERPAVAAVATDDHQTQRAALPAPEDEAEAPAPAGDEEPESPFARATETSRIGAIEIVDPGLDARELPVELAAQYALAQDAGQTMVVMLTSRRCTPCRSFDAALPHPSMQEALADVRLVRLELDIFRDELKRMHLPTTMYPAFFLFDETLAPIDAIHDGEWDEDIAANMAPVLRHFVRGTLGARRHADWAPTTSSIEL